MKSCRQESAVLDLPLLMDPEDDGTPAPAPTFMRPYQGKIRIRIKGREFLVPEGQKVLRIFQYLRESFELDVGRFCWNHDCQTCSFSFEDGRGQVRNALACQKIAEDGMEIRTVPWPIKVLRPLEPGDEDEDTGPRLR